MLYCFIQNVNIATLHYIGSAQCYIALCRTFIVLYCLYSVHSATLPYTEWSYCYISFYRTFVVLLCIIQDVHSATVHYTECSYCYSAFCSVHSATSNYT